MLAIEREAVGGISLRSLPVAGLKPSLGSPRDLRELGGPGLVLAEDPGRGALRADVAVHKRVAKLDLPTLITIAHTDMSTLSQPVYKELRSPADGDPIVMRNGRIEVPVTRSFRSSKATAP